jgi:hypothetical protein
MGKHLHGKQLRPLHVNSIRSTSITRGSSSLRTLHSTSTGSSPRHHGSGQPAGPFRAQVRKAASHKPSRCVPWNTL